MEILIPSSNQNEFLKNIYSSSCHTLFHGYHPESSTSLVIEICNNVAQYIQVDGFTQTWNSIDLHIYAKTSYFVIYFC